MKNTSAKDILSIGIEDNNTVIVSHKNPDGDALGSTLAMHYFLEKIGKSSQIVLPDLPPAFLRWLPGANTVSIFDKDKDNCKEIIAKASTIICLDFNETGRVGKEMEEELSSSNAKMIMIDHHLNPSEIFDYAISNPTKSSTCEMVFDFICEAGYESEINKDIAECLYVGLMTDTGNFAFSCNNPSVFRAAAKFVEAGCRPNFAFNMIYNNNSESRIRLLGFALNERLKVFPEYYTAYIYLSQDDMKQFDFKRGDTEGLVNYCTSIKGIYFGGLIKEMKDYSKLSLRSIGNFSVNNFANRHFNGGGHRNAAGGNSHIPLEDTLSKFEKLIPLYKSEIENTFKSNE